MESNKFAVFKDFVDDDGFSYAQMKDGVAEVVGLSDNPSEDLQHELLGADNFKTNRKLTIQRSHTDGSYKIKAGYTQSAFQKIQLFWMEKIFNWLYSISISKFWKFS